MNSVRVLTEFHLPRFHFKQSDLSWVVFVTAMFKSNDTPQVEKLVGKEDDPASYLGFGNLSVRRTAKLQEGTTAV